MRWEVEITDLDSRHTVEEEGEEIELVCMYTIKLSAATQSEAEKRALELFRREYPSLSGHQVEVRSAQIYRSPRGD